MIATSGKLIRADGAGSQKVILNLVAEIVSSYVVKNGLPVDQVGGLIAAIHQTAERAW